MLIYIASSVYVHGSMSSTHLEASKLRFTLPPATISGSIDSRGPEKAESKY